jgi:hypothetical protein
MGHTYPWQISVGDYNKVKSRKIDHCEVLEKINNNAYKLWFPNHLKIYDVFKMTYSCFYELHYQKIDKYKRKYRGNISVGKFPRDFTDGIIPSVYTEGITVRKKIKTKQKKNDDVSFLPMELPTEFIPSVIPSVNLLVNCEHCSSC